MNNTSEDVRTGVIKLMAAAMVECLPSAWQAVVGPLVEKALIDADGVAGEPAAHKLIAQYCAALSEISGQPKLRWDAEERLLLPALQP